MLGRKKKKTEKSAPESTQKRGGKKKPSKEKPRKKRQYKDRATRRQEILNAAETLFMTRGFLATGIADIAKAVGVSYGVFYHHFPTKRDILFAFVNIRLERTEKMVAEWSEDPSISPTEKMRRFLDLLDDFRQFRISVDYIRPGEPREDPELYDAFCSLALPRVAAMIAGIVEEGNKSDGFDVESPLALGILFYSMSLDILHRAATVDKIADRKMIRRTHRITTARMLGLPSNTFLDDK